MHFDWTINMGSIITGTALLLGFLKAHVDNKTIQRDMQYKVNVMYKWFEKHVIDSD